MKKTYVIFVLIFLCRAIIFSQESDNEISFLYDFLKGTYELIGRYPDSNETYTGRVEFKKSDDGLKVVRFVDGAETEGTGKIETATADSIKVFRVRFNEKGSDYEITYLISSDLDNYARLTGYFYLRTGDTRKPGIEALFSGHMRYEKK